MTKILIETGSESHTTSSASVVSKFVGGEHDGKRMFEVKQFIVSTRWYDSNDKSKTWVETIFDLPDGTRFEIIGRGRTGARGVDKSEFHQIFEVDSSQEVLETTVNVGLRQTDLKGRVRLVSNVLAAKARASEKARTEGF
jgi:hypothetical protein